MSKAEGSLDKYEKKDNHYIDKREFYQEMCAFKKDPNNIRLVENGERPIIPEEIAKKIMLLCEHHSYNFKFGDRFPFRDEMVLDAIETCIRYIWNFDEDKYDNPYGYFNRCISQEFIKRIKKEKKDFMKRAKYIQNLGVIEEFAGNNALFSDDTIGNDEETQAAMHEATENIQRFLDYDVQAEEDKEKKKKESRKKKASNGGSLDEFMKEDEDE